MKIAICDDEKIYRDLMESYIEAWAKERGRTAALFPFSNGEELLKSREENSYDVVLLDIQMPGIDGMSIARRLREAGDETCLLFITGYEEYMTEGYEVEAFRYLLKPVKEEKLWEALDRFCLRKRKTPECLVAETGEGRKRVAVKEITFIEAFAHNCELHTVKGGIEVKTGISELEKQAKEFGLPLFRCHRSYMVNIAQVTGIEKDAAVLADGGRIPVSRRMYHDLNQAFIRFFSRGGNEWPHG